MSSTRTSPRGPWRPRAARPGTGPGRTAPRASTVTCCAQPADLCTGHQWHPRLPHLCVPRDTELQVVIQRAHMLIRRRKAAHQLVREVGVPAARRPPEARSRPGEFGVTQASTAAQGWAARRETCAPATARLASGAQAVPLSTRAPPEPVQRWAGRARLAHPPPGRAPGAAGSQQRGADPPSLWD